MRSLCRILGAAGLLTFFAAGCSLTDQSEDLGETTQVVLTTGPDLVESAISGPATVRVGQSFAVNDTVTNQGTLASAASKTAYYLSTTSTAPFNNVLRFSAQRSVGAVAAGATDAGSVTLVIPTSSASVSYTNGTFYVVACIDYGNAVAETNETNNCGASASAISVQAPDLVVTATSEPPADLLLGQPFTVSDTTANNGTIAAGAFTNVYYLSTTGVAPFNYVLRFDTQRAISGIGVGQTNTGSTTIFAPAGNSDVAAYFGTFYLVTCADYANAVAEGNEGNNCKASSGTTYVHGPDLQLSNLTLSTTAVDLSGTVTFGDTVTDVNTTDSPASAVGYVLSTDTVRDVTDGVLTACTSSLGSYWTRSVPALTAGTSNSGTAAVGPLCVDDGTSVHVPAPGAYYVFVCADIYRTVYETNERNNCVRLPTQLTLSLCGDGIIEGTEQCDDGGTVPGDGCSATCTIETNGAPTITSVPPSPAYVNNLYTYNATETDPDGPTAIWSLLNDTCGGAINSSTGVYTFTPASTGTCDVGIQVCDGGVPNKCTSQATTITKIAAVCGNGTLEPGEQCDDSNTNNGDGCSATCQFQTLTSVTVTPANSNVAKGQTLQYAATANYSDGWTNVVTGSATWATGNSAIATISTSALVTGVDNTATGGTTATTSVSATYGGTTGTTNVTVTAPVVVDVVVTPGGASIAKFTKQQFEADAVYSDGTVVNVTGSTTWASSPTTIATISSTGLATGVSAGDATISGTYSGITDSVTLTITSANISSITVTPANATMATGTSQQYTATGTFSDGTTQDLSSYATWGSTNTTGAATVSSTGVVTTVSTITGSSATATISATFKNTTGQTGLTVVKGILQSVAVTPASATLPKGYQKQFTATATFKNGTSTFTLDVTTSAAWTSSSTATATVNAKGVATAKAAGSTTIKATYGGMFGTAALTVSNATLVSIAITPNPVSIAKGASTQLTATGTFNDNSTLDITTQVNWTSSAKSIASVNAKGKLTGKKVGTATVTAKKGTVSGTVAVTIN